MRTELANFKGCSYHGAVEEAVERFCGIEIQKDFAGYKTGGQLHGFV